MRTFIIALLIGAIGTAWSAAQRETWKDNSHLLPDYCKVRAKANLAKGSDPEWGHWRRALGTAAISVHHYCEGIYSEIVAKSTMDRKLRRSHLRNVIAQMRYVGKTSCKVGCVLYPELHKRWGWALAEQGESDAIEHYRISIKAKPDYVAAYAGLSDFYLKIKQQEQAVKVLEDGLRAAPRSRLLKRRLEKLREAQ